jgi:ribose transport system permease protein
MGNPFTLNSVAAVVIGGISLAGGKGTVLGAMLGGAVLSMVINIIYYANVPSVYQEFVKGAIIIVALALTIVYRRRASRLVGMGR